MAGTAVAEISVARDGSLSVQRIQAHPVFEKPVRDALERWRFGPAGQEEKLQVTVRFEFDETWEGTDKHPLTAETRVSAELPSMVHVVTGLKGLEVTNSSEN
jgi:hypothetical protein